jgi:16S rRNA (uracil1498-N3)-methyltransferase
MHSFYLPEKITGDTASITEAEQLHHLRDVLRLKVGDEITVFDGEGNEYRCTIRELDNKQAILVVKAGKPAQTPILRLTIACAIPKQSKMDEIIDKLTQLGVNTIIPLVTERVIVKMDEAKGTRLERWKKIARSAAEQSHRNTLPVISPVTNLKEVLNQSGNYQLKLAPTLEGERETLKEVLMDSKPASILVLIGPEGDFTPQEVLDILRAGFRPISLGDLVLRVETAAIAVASYIRFTLDN